MMCMGKFQSTKVIDLGSCAFRQPRADSHCKYIHGYRLKAKFWFEARELDNNHWVVDFGSLKPFKKLLQCQFDHTTCIAADDPSLSKFELLAQEGDIDLRVMEEGVGIERTAEWCYIAANRFTMADIDAYVTYSFAKWIKIDGAKNRNNFKNWLKKNKERKSIKIYSNLFSQITCIKEKYV